MHFKIGDGFANLYQCPERESKQRFEMMSLNFLTLIILSKVLLGRLFHIL